MIWDDGVDAPEWPMLPQAAQIDNGGRGGYREDPHATGPTERQSVEEPEIMSPRATP